MSGFHLGACLKGDDEPPGLDCNENCPKLLRAKVEALEDYMSPGFLLNLYGEKGWPHERNNPCGKWCCEHHRQEFYDERGFR